jgi:hypothetical protein
MTAIDGLRLFYLIGKQRFDMGSNNFQNYFQGLPVALIALIRLNDFCHVFVTSSSCTPSHSAIPALLSLLL